MPAAACRLHFIRGGEAQDVDAGFQNVLGQADEGDVAGLQLFIFLGQNPGLMVELVDAAGQVIDIGADQIGGRGLQGALHGRAELGDGQHRFGHNPFVLEKSA